MPTGHKEDSLQALGGLSTANQKEWFEAFEETSKMLAIKDVIDAFSKC